MSQLLKHYWINRDTGLYALTPANGYMLPYIKGLNLIHQLSDENDMQFCLSTCPEYFEYSVTISSEQLTYYQNNPNYTIISSVEREVEVSTSSLGISTTTDETTTAIVYDIVYQEAYDLALTDGIWIITQQEWNNEIVAYNARQEQKKYNVIRPIRNQILLATDWIVIKAKEQGTDLSSEFKDWRHALRDLPSSQTFPTGFPPLPSNINDSKILELYNRWSEVENIPTITA